MYAKFDSGDFRGVDIHSLYSVGTYMRRFVCMRVAAGRFR